MMAEESPESSGARDADGIPPEKPPIDFAAFDSVDLRVGVVKTARVLPKARVPAIALEIDFGPLGIRQSSARLTRRYRPEELPGRRVVALVNVAPRRVAGFRSDVLVLGGFRPATASGGELVDEDGAQDGEPGLDDVSLLAPDHDDIPPGTPIA